MVFASKVCQGRVVYFNRPASDTASDNSAVTSGLVVIDSGPYTGQRVEFEADQCYLFGYTLRNADLGQIFRISEFFTSTGFVSCFDSPFSNIQMSQYALWSSLTIPTASISFGLGPI